MTAPAGASRLAELVRGVRDARFLRGVVVGVCLTLLPLVGLSAWTWSAAVSEACAELPREDLSIDEMVSIKQRVDAYRRDPSRPLELSGREASFLVREHLGVRGWLTIEGDEVRMELRLPSGGRCYDVSFRGAVDARSAGAVGVVPSSLVVGRLDLSWWAAGRRIEILPAQVEGEAAAALVGHLTALQVQDGRIALEVDDPETLK